MMHAYHNALPGYDERQIWHDGCEECEARGKSVPASVRYLDDDRLERAYSRAGAWAKDDWTDLGNLSDAELPLLRFLEGVIVVNRRLGVSRLEPAP